jgi:hypothetical protein
MATFDYTRTAATALRLLERFGMSVIYKVKEPGIYDPVTGKVSYGYLGERWTETEVQAVSIQYDLRVVDGNLIRLTDLQILLAPTLAAEPKQGDVVVIPIDGGEFEEYEVVTNRTISPAGTPVLYEVQARKD